MPYDTPTSLGVKWQMDVKYVPAACYASQDGQKFYQYTMRRCGKHHRRGDADDAEPQHRGQEQVPHDIDGAGHGNGVHRACIGCVESPKPRRTEAQLFSRKMNGMPISGQRAE